MSGCACLNCAQMVKGQTYTFHFRYSSIFRGGSAQALQDTVSNDSNFGNPSATIIEHGIFAGNTVDVSFTYQGQGSLVGQAGQEMQNVINNFWTNGLFSSLVFDSASVGVTSPDCAPCACNAWPWWFWLALLGIAGYGAIQLGILAKLKGALSRAHS